MLIVDYIENWSLPNMLSPLKKVVTIIFMTCIIKELLIVNPFWLTLVYDWYTDQCLEKVLLVI